MSKQKYSSYSVLMSVYAKEKSEFLYESIDSMLKQTLKPDQFVLVEDGPLGDELQKVINKFCDENKGLFTIVSLPQNVGLGRALDIGMVQCKTELIARMDSDDISLPTRCERELEAFNTNEELDIISCNILEFCDDPTKIIAERKVPTTQAEIKKRMRTRSAFNHPAVMYKKSVVIKCGGYGELKRKQDHDLFSRMMNCGCIAQNLEEPLLLFRSSADNLKRRKSWENCKSYVIAQWNIFKRKECSFCNFMYVLCAQLFFFLAPNQIVQAISDKYLREAVK